MHALLLSCLIFSQDILECDVIVSYHLAILTFTVGLQLVGMTPAQRGRVSIRPTMTIGQGSRGVNDHIIYIYRNMARRAEMLVTQAPRHCSGLLGFRAWQVGKGLSPARLGR